MKDHGAINTYCEGGMPNHTPEAVPNGWGAPIAARIHDEAIKAARRWNVMVDLMVLSAHEMCPEDNVLARFGAALAGIEAHNITRHAINDAMDAALECFNGKAH